MTFLASIRRQFLNPAPPPPELKSVFLHFALDIGWYGVLNGSILAFISIYITRLGGSAIEVGMINAIPGVVTLLLALPAGQWLTSRQVSWDVFTSSVLARIFYLVLVAIPALISPGEQIMVIILVISLMSIPGTVTNVGFTALLGEGTPPVWRGYLSGIRNGLFAITNVLTLLLCGWILDKVTFPTGYQIVFAIGSVGAAMSSLHLFFLHRTLHDTSDTKKPAQFISGNLFILKNMAPEAKRIGKSLLSLWNLRLDILKGPFLATFLLMLSFHFVQFIGIPIFPVYSVNVLYLSDQVISLGLAMFYATVFIGSTQVARLTNKLGHKTLFGIAVCFFGLYPAMLIFSTNITMYLITNAISGLVWAMAGGAIFNYVLDKSPSDDRPSHIAWYTIALNLGMLLGSLGGPWLADAFSLLAVLVICGIVRFLAGLAILRWG